MHIYDFLEESSDILPKILVPSKITTLLRVSHKFRHIIEKYQIPGDFVSTNRFYRIKNKSIKIIEYLNKNKKINFTNIILNFSNIELIKELFQNNIFQQYKNITKFEFCNITDGKSRINNINTLCEGLLQFPKLNKFELRSNQFEPIENEKIFNTLSKLTSLEILDLYENNIDNKYKKSTDRGAERLSNTLLFLTNLKELNLGMNCIGFINLEGIEEVTKALPNLKSLLHLNISSNFFEEEGYKIIMKGILHLTQLKGLDISTNYVRSGIKSLINILPNLKSLSYLNISNNSLKSEGIEIFTKGLPYLKNLKILNISTNYIGTTQFYYLINVLYNNCSLLIDLNLSNNNIGRNTNIFEILNVCNVLKLKCLNLSRNNIGLYIDSTQDSTEVSTNELLNINTSLKYLDLRLNCVELLEISRIPEIKKKYKSLSNIKLPNIGLDEEKNNIINKLRLQYPSSIIDTSTVIFDCDSEQSAYSNSDYESYNDSS
jgi:Ran GTPase-activating protein (RanGAP) involved in mRNA processing and transport